MQRIDSNHARRRIKQRGVREPVLAALLECGDREIDVGGGCVAVSLSREARKSLPSGIAERTRHLVAVIHGSSLVTVLHASGQRGTRYGRFLR